MALIVLINWNLHFSWNTRLRQVQKDPGRKCQEAGSYWKCPKDWRTALKPGVLCQVHFSTLAQLYPSPLYYDSYGQPYFIALYPAITFCSIRVSNSSSPHSKLGKHSGYLLSTMELHFSEVNQWSCVASGDRKLWLAICTDTVIHWFKSTNIQWGSSRYQATILGTGTCWLKQNRFQDSHTMRRI